MLFIVAMEFSVDDSAEAVDQLGIWTKAKVVSKSDILVFVYASCYVRLKLYNAFY